jgi:hypothetical protein
MILPIGFVISVAHAWTTRVPMLPQAQQKQENSQQPCNL